MNFECIDFLNSSEIDRTLASVEKLQEYWKHRGPAFVDLVPFYTLGAVEYMDLEEKSQAYYEEYAAKMNPILWQEFEWLYIKIKNFFEQKYQAPFEYYDKKSALPGFHIFLDNDLFEIPISSRHCDLQFRKLNWQGMEYDQSTHLSFTIYLTIPQTGAGMNVWEYFYHELEHLDAQSREDLLSESEYEYLNFAKGQIVIHSGFQYHQIAPTEEVIPGDRRISLQGHAIKANGKYWIHW